LNEKSEQTTTIELTDMNGKVVLTKNAGIINGYPKIVIDISSLATGTYLVSVLSGNKKGFKKIIIP
jgi:hypothetical protein